MTSTANHRYDGMVDGRTIGVVTAAENPLLVITAFVPKARS
jgi:hypothetical protein